MTLQSVADGDHSKAIKKNIPFTTMRFERSVCYGRGVNYSALSITEQTC